MAKIRERSVFDQSGTAAGVHLDFVECGDLLQELEEEQCASPMKPKRPVSRPYLSSRRWRKSRATADEL